MILGKGDSGTLHDAVDGSCKPISVPGIIDLSQRFGVITMSESPDACTVNDRKRSFTRMLLKDCKNVLISRMQCSVHQVQRAFASTIDMARVSGDAFAIRYTTNDPATLGRLQKTMWDLVNDELIVVVGSPPPDSKDMWARHMDGILQHTLLRSVDLVPGCIDRSAVFASDDGVSDSIADGCTDSILTHRRLACEKVKKFINCDPRSDRLTHYCNGCCDNVYQAKMNVYGAIIESRLIEGAASRDPSSARYGTTSDSLADQQAGRMICRIVPRCYTKAFPRWQSADLDPDAPEDRRQQTRSKV